MLKTIDDNIYAIINRKLLSDKKLTSNARNVLYTLLTRNKNEIYEIMITTFSSESVFNLKRDLFIKALNELIKVDYLKYANLLFPSVYLKKLK